MKVVLQDMLGITKFQDPGVIRKNQLKRPVLVGLAMSQKKSKKPSWQKENRPKPVVPRGFQFDPKPSVNSFPSSPKAISKREATPAGLREIPRRPGELSKQILEYQILGGAKSYLPFKAPAV